ncbi:hypothetical protein G7046_g850 [Stylonectria norvegica]|nr:hypothetical protein G7046_g850 [Stylonectria norvegica]
MSEEFEIENKVGPALRLFFHSQLFRTPPNPTRSFSNQTIIITGANVGLGLEAARHFYRLNCARLILAVRNVSRGQMAKENIIQSIKQRTDADTIEVWPLDLSSTPSTLAFAERVKEKLIRLDVLVENAGVNNKIMSFSEGIEQTMQVNVLNTFLLALSLLPKMKETAELGNSLPHLTIVTSEAHRLSKFRQLNALDIYEDLNDDKSYNGQNLYETSKLMEILLVRELVSRTKGDDSGTPSVIVNLANPGLCVSTLATRNEKPIAVRIVESVLYTMIARTTEVGSRTLILGAGAGSASHGEFMSDGHNQNVEQWIYTDVGKRAQKKVFDQTMKLLEMRSPGIGAVIDSTAL